MTSKAKLPRWLRLIISDILVFIVSFKCRSQNPEFNGRDRFILSKGHAGAAVYAALAVRFFRH